MSKSTLTEAVINYFKNNSIGVSQKLAGNLVDSIFAHIASSLQSAGRFAYPGFGAFRVKVRAARSGKNPLTGGNYSTPEKKVIRFSQAKAEEKSFWTDLSKAKLFKGKAPKAPAKKEKAGGKKDK